MNIENELLNDIINAIKKDWTEEDVSNIEDLQDIIETMTDSVGMWVDEDVMEAFKDNFKNKINLTNAQKKRNNGKTKTK